MSFIILIIVIIIGYNMSKNSDKNAFTMTSHYFNRNYNNISRKRYLELVEKAEERVKNMTPEEKERCDERRYRGTPVDYPGETNYWYMDRHGKMRSRRNNSVIMTAVIDSTTGDMVTMDGKGYVYQNFSEEGRVQVLDHLKQEFNHYYNYEQNNKQIAMDKKENVYKGYDWKNPVRISHGAVCENFPEVWKRVDDDSIVTDRNEWEGLLTEEQKETDGFGIMLLKFDYGRHLGLNVPMEKWIDCRTKRNYQFIRQRWYIILKKEYGIQID